MHSLDANVNIGRCLFIKEQKNGSIEGERADVRG